MTWYELLLVLIGIHFLCDYPLQTEFLAKGKASFDQPLNGVPWYHCMTAHCAVHALGVGLATRVWELALAEFVCHFIIDTSKAQKRFGINIDQALHITCKAVWVYQFYKFPH